MEQIQEEILRNESSVTTTSSFIESNTISASMEEIKKEHNYPDFYKRQCKACISHAEFIERVFLNVCTRLYPGEEFQVLLWAEASNKRQSTKS